MEKLCNTLNRNGGGKSGPDPISFSVLTSINTDMKIGVGHFVFSNTDHKYKSLRYNITGPVRIDTVLWYYDGNYSGLPNNGTLDISNITSINLQANYTKTGSAYWSDASLNITLS